MVALPKQPAQEVISRVYDAIKKADARDELYLGRLGSSSIGDECIRKIWLSWRAYFIPDFDGRMIRLFGTGHWQESRIVEDLRRAGLEVWDKTEQGEQFEYTDDEQTGHFITKVDGVLKGYPGCVEKPHILEIKTHNKNSFFAVEKHGVQKSKPEHYAQVQTSMGLSGITRTIYVALCKDNEQLYIERIKEDKTEQKKLMQKVITLVNATLKPAGISDEPLTSKLCMFCDGKEVCAGKVSPVRSCRSCVNADAAILKGEWVCRLTGQTLTKDAQRAGCAEYEVL
jgi:hypothetical protein